MRLYNMLGYKLFKENEDGSIHMLRIVGMHKPFKITDTTKDPSEITVYDYDTEERTKVRVDSLKEYSPLKPDGILTLSVVTMSDGNGGTSKDVVVTASKFLNIEFGIDNTPYAVCRQSITDVFQNLVASTEDDMLVGLAINKDTCPPNFDFGIMFAANDIVHSDFLNFYRTDTLEGLLDLINTSKYDECLSDLYNRHIKAIKKPELMFKNEHGGWCKNLKTLLNLNCFQADINQMLGIAGVDFELAQYFEDKETERDGEKITYQVLNDVLRYWLSSLYKININEANVLEFDHDINLGDFNDNKYLLIRDNTDKLYLIVYTTEGEYFEDDLVEKSKEFDFTTKFKLAYMSSKYAE